MQLELAQNSKIVDNYLLFQLLGEGANAMYSNFTQSVSRIEHQEWKELRGEASQPGHEHADKRTYHPQRGDHPRADRAS